MGLNMAAKVFHSRAMSKRSPSGKSAVSISLAEVQARLLDSQHYLGSAIVDTKTNEIPIARELLHKLDLDGRKVSLDALHTQDQTARAAVLEHGADFPLTVKDNQPTVKQNIEKLVPAPPADFSPSPGQPHPGRPA